jgi:hypothetical protein
MFSQSGHARYIIPFLHLFGYLSVSGEYGSGEFELEIDGFGVIPPVIEKR